MKVTLTENSCLVEREPTDKKIYSESLFWYKVKQELQKQGHDVIKKLMWKDGHLVSDKVYYIRERKGKFAIWDSAYAVRFTYEPYNRDGIVDDLTIEREAN